MPTINVRDGRVIITHPAGSETFDTVEAAIAWCRSLRNQADDITLAASKIEEQIREQAGTNVRRGA